MKICLIGYFDGNPDEGIKNINRSLYKALSTNNEVLTINVKELYTQLFLIKGFNPEIIHFLVGPSSLLIFFISKIMSVICNKSAIIISALQPTISYHPKLISLLKPTVVLVQSESSKKFFELMGCKTAYFSNFVDIDKYIPVTYEKKNALRDKYGVDKKKFIILHVGHLKKSRNIGVFKNIQSNDNQVIIVSSTSTKVEEELSAELKKSGCIVWTRYFENLEEIYALSDCYVFPTFDLYSCIETPLSVLEAMACNLPLISTKYKALPDLFLEGFGLKYIKNNEDIRLAIEELKNTSISIKTRKNVLSYSVKTNTQYLEHIYLSSLAEVI